MERILKESSDGRFLIRWKDFGPESDTWEPEENVAPAEVAEFRQRSSLLRSNAGDDFHLGRTKMLWCCSCGEHKPADCFSSNQRRGSPHARTCLNHHYRIGEPSRHTAPFTPGPRPGGRLSTTAAGAVDMPSSASRAASASKRAREEEADAASPSPPPPPKRAVARELSARHAELEVSRCRLYGFSSW